MHPTRFVNLPAARARFGDRVDRLGSFLTRTDPLADAVAADLAGLHGGWRLFEQAARGGVEPASGVPASFGALLDSVRTVPLWVDWETLDRGGEVLLRAGVLGGIVLGLKSLVLGYAAPAGNKPLVLTGRLEEQAIRRLNETARFVQATITPGSMRPGGEGWMLTLKVRLIHAHVRRMILESGRWDAAAWGAPANQHDHLGTSLLFSVVLLQGLRQLGLRISTADADAYVQLWRWSGWLMGIDPELLVGTEAEGARLADLIAATEGKPDDDSRRLTRALLEAPLREARTERQRVNAGRHVRFSSAMCRELVGDAMADSLGVAESGYRLLVPFARRLVRSVELVRERVPYGDASAVWAGARYWERVVAIGFAGATAELGIPQGLARAA